ncbi:MAG: tetratricopeptide repeat protein [Treponema sp.]|nr:tetratricopeptide repeat protein [Treponema sp.]MCL2250995.1 tetratricopeptide repeat protein [Treponema sp.]
MKKFKEFIIAVLLIAFTVSVVLLIYNRTSTRLSRDLAKRMAEISPRGGPPETIEGLRQAIALYEDQIERNVKEGAQTGVYWKILAMRLADRNMHNDALDALERAIYFNSEDAVLYYLTGVSAGSVAKSIVGFSANASNDREQFFNLSEKSYLRALELDITYTRPMYGLGVLYTFELDRPSDAIVQLERYLQIQTSDISAMFVLARAYFMAKNYEKAIEIYERISNRSKDKNIKEEALINRDFIQGMRYE